MQIGQTRPNDNIRKNMINNNIDAIKSVLRRCAESDFSSKEWALHDIESLHICGCSYSDVRDPLITLQIVDDNPDGFFEPYYYRSYHVLPDENTTRDDLMRIWQEGNL